MNLEYQRHIYFMRRAIELAELGRGKTSPNPMVGCVIVKNGKIIGEGYHEEAGKPHAEINALNTLTESPEGTIIYISLEPCIHYGKTPPCVPKIIEAKPSEVVIAMQDPNPLVSGKGISELRNQGIKVTVGVLEHEAKKQNEVFIKYITTKMPFVIAKWAMSIDGKIATKSKNSKYLTSIESLRLVHKIRNDVDSILIGGNTAIIDNPYLTPRLVEKTSNRTKIRVVLDKKSGLPENLNIFKFKEGAETWIATPFSDRRYKSADRVIVIPPVEGKIPLGKLMEELGKENITSVLIEGGGETFSSAFSEGLIDKVFVFIAPTIVGGKDAPTPIEGNGLAETVADGINLRIENIINSGRDIVIIGYPE
ncbi:MAG: bifunctional diaminohydroxyphosphoribosylaminopyrimidine deaminase/5-amino-6-(5-phosphoribosylamino)uracil reductase RibD [Candidatus Hydrogenedentes bacterium]|nr:bifunctional diaminohydroxyphosphoribosylaminopyrimidine deaminase/5-amino-6-(5-phosphoribosylamino)uracil reductase RibD [Candidatus Hydrogenedentota bacterium]